MEDESSIATQVSKLREDLVLAETKISDLQSELSLGNEHKMELSKAIKQLQGQLELEQANTKACKKELVTMNSKLLTAEKLITELERHLLIQIQRACYSKLGKKAPTTIDKDTSAVIGGQTYEEVLSGCVDLKIINQEQRDLVAEFAEVSQESSTINQSKLKKTKDALVVLLPKISIDDQLFFLDFIPNITAILN